MHFGRLKVIGVTVALAATLLLSLIGKGLLAFTDLGGHWAASAVAALQVRGLIAGYPDGSFDPGRLLTRAEMAKLFAVMLGQASDAQALVGVNTRFADLPGDHWAAGYVETLAELRLLRGDTDGTFHPDRDVTRAELSVLLARAAGLENSPADPAALLYLDLEAIPTWARGAVAADTRTGLLTGDDTGVFRPRDGVTRAEAAAAMLRLLAYRGSAFHLIGTFLSYDAASGHLIVQDAANNSHTVTLAPDAAVFRQGAPVAATELVAADQVWIYMGADGLVHDVDARFRAYSGVQAKVSGDELSFVRGLSTMRLKVQPGARIFVNGRAAPLANVNGAQKVYAAVDVSTGEARLVDAVQFQAAGVVRAINPPQSGVVVDQNGLLQRYTTADSTIIFRDGRRVGLNELAPGDQVLLQFDTSLTLSYIQAERPPG